MIKKTHIIFFIAFFITAIYVHGEVNKIVVEYGDATTGFAQRKCVVEYSLYESTFKLNSIEMEHDSNMPKSIPIEIVSEIDFILSNDKLKYSNVSFTKEDINKSIALIKDSGNIEVDILLLSYGVSRNECIRRIKQLKNVSNEQLRNAEKVVLSSSPKLLFSITLFDSSGKKLKLRPRSCYKDDYWIADDRYIESRLITPLIKKYKLDHNLVQYEKCWYVIRLALQIPLLTRRIDGAE